ncbi:TauD/TfdA family dioxygenase [Ramlibacter sp. USB13]|uniref:TauD/TfdA family dioxygenase n=1 Tax=Ramlibacter cellulosilyticus TaxID=2764187 RepID=A0A923SCI2_9BURK|nr:TauD/TfdA family dioxygenase [Ramlibacter cellulosilyticus]MBC5784991.1 TauD/TfdA family dioxygenase [Ramlibacter cellulosilyticus]
MAIRHTPITPALGATIEGVDLAEITPAEFRQVHEIWKKHHVVVLRGQRLTNAQFERFSAMIGELDPPPNQGAGRKSVPGYPNLYVVSNRKNAQGEPIGALGDGEASWHTDMSYLERPPLASMLWSVELPSTGGDTWFASMPAALRAMPADLVARVRRLAIKHDGTYDSGGNLRKGMVANDDPRESVGTLHPIVIVQPETGEHTLYLGRRRNAWIAGLPVDESERLLNIIWSYATMPEITLRHQWKLGDVVLWNNLTTMHRRDAFPADEVRTLHRSQIKGKYVLASPIQQEAA